VPTVATTHLIIDLPTLFAVTVFISISAGLLLLFSWLQNRATIALAYWGVGYLLGAAAAAVLGSGEFTHSSSAVCAANALMCAAYGVMWGGARSFEGRSVHTPLILAGAVIWVVVFQLDGFSQSIQARVSLVSAILATYALLSARELWYARDRELISRWPTLALVVLHAGFILARIPLADLLAVSAVRGQPQGIIVFVMAFEAVFAIFCLPFLRIAMSKERVELEQRRAALTDALTGIANRRAFFYHGGPLLERVVADRRPAALLLFDLDRFKEVNDTAGHQTGDRVLMAFSDLVTASLRSGDLFARLGGEEFACFLLNASVAEALQTADRLRRQFAALRFPGLPESLTVSVGVAMASADRSLAALLATADRALYRAKADGRNRVAPAPLVLIDTTGDQAALDTARTERPAAFAAPMAG